MRARSLGVAVVVFVVVIVIFIAVAFLFVFFLLRLLSKKDINGYRANPRYLCRDIPDVFCTCSMVRLMPFAKVGVLNAGRTVRAEELSRSSVPSPIANADPED